VYIFGFRGAGAPVSPDGHSQTPHPGLSTLAVLGPTVTEIRFPGRLGTRSVTLLVLKFGNRERSIVRLRAENDPGLASHLVGQRNARQIKAASFDQISDPYWTSPDMVDT
jgi:hypothetical protein